MVDRIKKLIEKQKLTATQFAEEIGVQRSAVSHLLSGRNKPSLDFMLKIKNKFPDISLDWLLLGQGKMKEIDQEKIKIKEDVQSSLFQADTKTVLKEGLSEENVAVESEILLNVAKSEDELPHGTSTNKTDESPKKMILIYPDHTFKVFDAR